MSTVGANSSLMALISSTSIVPALYEAQLFLQSVQAPSLSPRWLPGIIGPVMRGRTGLLADIPPINCAGTVLSHPTLTISNPYITCQYERVDRPPIITHASIGCALIISSVSILIKFLKNILVGCANDSCNVIVGKSIARPPANCTPRFVASMSCGTFAWQGL